MELKPIKEMDMDEVHDEIYSRLGLPTNQYNDLNLLRALRAKDIGTENLTPPEPEWKRWRNVSRDGEPTKGGWYWVKFDSKDSILHWPRDGGFWTSVIAYCPIAPAPPYEGESE